MPELQSPAGFVFGAEGFGLAEERRRRAERQANEFDISKSLKQGLLWILLKWTIGPIIAVFSLIFGLGLVWNFGFYIVKFAWALSVYGVEAAAEGLDQTYIQRVIVKSAQKAAELPPSRIDRMLQRWVWLLEIDYLSYPEMMLGAFIGLLVIVTIWRKQLVRRTVYRMRGIHFGEALVEGSEFVVGEQPACQGKVCQASLFTSRFCGNCIRIGDILVLQDHVKSAVKDSPLIEGPAGSLFLTSGGVSSTIFPDYRYYQLSPREWSILGMKQASIVPPGVLNSRVTVKITSQGKTSSATLTKGGRIGMVFYNGSTEDGFSGAGYFDATNQLVGIHYGISDSRNCGFAATVILAEITQLFRASGEAKNKKKDYEQPEQRESGRSFRPTVSGWSESDILRKIGQGSDLGWAIEDDFDYDATLDFGEKMDPATKISDTLKAELPKLDGPALTVLAEYISSMAKLSAARGFQPQCQGGSQTATPGSVPDTFDNMLLATVKNHVEIEVRKLLPTLPLESGFVKSVDFENLSKRVEALETQNGETNKARPSDSGKSGPESEKIKYSCDFPGCNFSSPSRMGLKMHSMMKHQDKPEARQRPAAGFLAKKKEKVLSGTWVKPLNSSVQPTEFSHLISGQQKMLDLLTQLVTTLGKQPASTNGQSSEETPSLSV